MMVAMPTLPLPPLPDALPVAAPLLVALSGGLDSTVLLHRLAAEPELRERGLRAIHVEHGLHPAAADWGPACEALCAGLAIPLARVAVRVEAHAGRGTEAAARESRHAAFASALQAGEVLALAHHRDDQAETFLLRALRASGPDGLAAMRAWRRFGDGWLWRPFLALPRDALLAYARHHGLDWVEDPSNTDEAFDRNFIRHRVLPVLRERWPHAAASLARSAALNAGAVDLLADGDAEALAQAGTVDPRILSASALASLPVVRRQRVLRRWIAGLGLPPLPAQGIAHVECDLLVARNDADARFAWHGARILRWGDLLHADLQRPALPRDWQAAWDGRAPLELPGGGMLALEGASALPCPCRVHARHGGERIQLAGRTHQHALKHVLQSLQVPPWVRAHLPLLSGHDGTLLAAGDLVHAAGFDAWLRGNGARLRWCEPSPPVPAPPQVPGGATAIDP